MNKDPREFGFNASTWSIDRMREHIRDKYGRLYSYERMRQIIKSLNNSYKRAEYHPTLANAEAQKCFKKIAKLITLVENSSDKVIYVCDETATKDESTNRKTWSPVGHPPVIERNASSVGLKLIGATEITTDFQSVIDAYPYKETINSDKFIEFLQRLIDINAGKKVFVILDNAKIHKSSSIENFELRNIGKLELIYLPPYSPELNPQENVWNLYKASIFTYKAKHSIENLYKDTLYFYQNFNKNIENIKRLVAPRKYYS
ncbi:IS630 family transposase [Clostridium sp. DMHC 10]|uniref:IS630 family transposase n=1 Tax=Clostridium sp. DMHC 10 TaxID=747377 RepID=UPI00241D5596|nr:IS630 family transposase [Clostridium sp. DMHC 10]